MVKKVFIIIPAYNASATITSVFERIPSEVHNRVDQFVVVNDGSTDDTETVLKNLSKRYPNLSILTHEMNQGYGAAEKTLLNFCVDQGAEAVILLHSDGQYSPEKILDLLKPIDDNEADIVQGSRMLGGGALKGGMPFYKYISNKALTRIENLAFGLSLAEYHSGFMLYSKKAFTEIPFNKLSNSFDFDLEMIIMSKVKRLRLKEVAIPTVYADEISHLKPIQYGLDVLARVWAYKRGKYDNL